MTTGESVARPTSVRLDPEVEAKLVKFCTRERRSRSSAINLIVDDVLDVDGNRLIVGGVAPLLNAG